MNALAHKIACQTRKWAERLQPQNSRDFTLDLGGMCAVASFELAHRLLDNGFFPLVAASYHHCFVLLDGFVIDLTATQFGFGYPTVLYCSVDDDMVQCEHWNDATTFRLDDQKELDELKQFFRDWPPAQQPNFSFFA